MECNCVCLSVSVCQDGWWWVGAVARSEENKCIYMFGGESGGGGLFSYLRLRSPEIDGGFIIGHRMHAHETNELMSCMFAID